MKNVENIDENKTIKNKTKVLASKKRDGVINMSQECGAETPVITAEDVAEAKRKKKEYNDHYRKSEKGKQTTKLCVLSACPAPQTHASRHVVFLTSISHLT